MKKAATTAANTAVTFEKKEVQLPINMNGHSAIQFIQMAVRDRRVDNFYVEVQIQSEEKSRPALKIGVYARIEPYQKLIDTAYFPHADSVVAVKKDEWVVISILPRPGFENENFDYANVSYRLIP